MGRLLLDLPVGLGGVLALALTIAACGLDAGGGTSEGGEPQSARQTLVGTEAPEATYAVAICAGSPGTCALRCSGIVLSRNVVATVRHCVDALPDREDVDCRSATFVPASVEPSLYVVTDPNVTQTKGWHPVKRMVAPASTSACGADLALLVVDDAIGEFEVTPAVPVLDDGWISEASRQSLSVYAFGATSRVATDQGTRRVMRGIKIDCVAGTGCEDRKVLGPNEISIRGNGLCSGDSGAAAIDDREPGNARIFGILSRAGAQGDACVGGVFERIDPWAPWIVRNVKQAAEEAKLPAPSWADSFPLVPAALGATCNDDVDCASSKCASADVGRSWQCSEPCGANGTCSDGFECKQGEKENLCFRPPSSSEPPSSCAATSGRSDAAATWMVALGVVALVTCCRRRATS